MKKRIKSLLLCFSILLNISISSAGAAASDINSRVSTDGQWAYDIIRSETITITKYLGNAANVTVPSSIDGYNVEQISKFMVVGYGAFEDKKSLKTVVISDGIKVVGPYAFMGCSNLTSVAFPESVDIVKEHAFHDCESLESIKWNVRQIGTSALEGCIRLKTITYLGEHIPRSMSESFTSSPPDFGGRALYNCTSLESIDFKGLGEVHLKRESIGGTTDNKKLIFYICADRWKTNNDYFYAKNLGFSIKTVAKYTQVQYYMYYPKSDSYVMTDSWDNNLYNPGDSVAIKYDYQGPHKDIYTNKPLSTLLGWTTQEHGTTPVYTKDGSNNTVVLTNKVLRLYSIYAPEVYTVTYESNGGSPVDTQTVQLDDVTLEPAVPTKKGYTFAGWFSDSGLTTAYSFGTAIKADVKLYAKWIPGTGTSYKVEHYQQNVAGDGYTLFGEETLRSKTDTTMTATPKTYPSFHENTGASGRVASGTVAADGSLVLKLYYDRDTYTAAFDSYGGNTVPSQNGIRYGGTVLKPLEPSKTSYNFGGWYTDDKLATVYSFNTPVTQSLTLYAKWIPRTDTVYKVEHYQQNVAGDGYTLFGEETLHGKTDATMTATPKTYPGFHENIGASGRVASGTVAADGNLMLKLYYDRNTYDVTFESNGGSMVRAQENIRFGGPAVEPAVPIREGYTFAGWFSDSGLTMAYSFGTGIKADVKLYAKWTPDTGTAYKVKYYQQNVAGDGYTLFEEKTLHGSTDATMTATPKTYPGFHENIGASGRVASGTVTADGSLVLQVYYDRDTYVVTFESNGGSTIPAQENIRFGSLAVEPAVPIREGYTFAGWFEDWGLTTDYNFNAKVEHNLTLHAKWILNDGTVDGVVENSNGDPVPGAKITIRAGNVDYKTTTTDKMGRFTIQDVEHGAYNLVAENNGVIVTKIIKIQHRSTSSIISLPGVKTNSVVEVLDETPQIVVGGLDTLYASNMIFTESDNAVVTNGGSIELSMSLESKKAAELGKDGAKISILPSETNALYLNIQLTKTVVESNGKTASKVLTELPQALVIYIPIEQGNAQSCKVFRVHNGLAEEIKKEPNMEGEFFEVRSSTVVVHAKKFSTYAISTYSYGGKTCDTSSSRYTITASTGVGGTVSPERASVTSGGSVTVRILPDEGHSIRTITADGQKVDVVNAYTFDNVHRDHSLTAAFLCPSKAYIDLDTKSGYHTAVDVMLSENYMVGTAANRWEPESAMTRAQTVMLLSKMDDGEFSSLAYTGFTDVNESAWYAAPVAWAAANGMSVGYGEGQFGPEDRITREQLVAILYRYMGNPKVKKEPPVVKGVSPWARDAVAWAIGSGVLRGDEHGAIQPQGSITRAETAMVLYQILKDTK